MSDLMFKAIDKTSWDAFADSFPNAADILIDEIGPIVTTPAIYENGVIVTPAVVDNAHHVNIRVLQPYIMSSDEPPIQIDVCEVLSTGGPGVTWIDPSTVNSPCRIWAGGMNYWTNSQEEN